MLPALEQRALNLFQHTEHLYRTQNAHTPDRLNSLSVSRLAEQKQEWNRVEILSRRVEDVITVKRDQFCVSAKGFRTKTI